MLPGRLLVLSAIAVLVPAAVIVAWSLNSLAKESERARARYREQSAGCARSARDAALGIARDVRLGEPPAIAFRADREGTLLEPTFEARRSERGDELIDIVASEVDGLERKGDLESVRVRLRELAEQSEHPEVAAWALTNLAAVEARAGELDAANAARRALVERFPDERDERGLKRSHAARFALAESPAEQLALYDDLIADRTALGQTAQAALAERVALELRATPSPELERSIETAHERVRRLRLATSWPLGISDWLARGANEGAKSFELAADPLDPTSDDVLIATAAGSDGTWRGGALEHSRIAALALERPELDAWRALGFRASFETRDGELVAGEAPANDDSAVLEALPAPLEALAVRAYGTDFGGFAKSERQRFVIVATLAIAAWLAAAIAAFFTVRAVTREARAAKQRQDFVAAVTHELKAPLASIRLLAELLERGGVEDEKVREFGARTVAESDRLSRLVASVLELARIERGEANGIARERVDLAELAREVVAAFETRAQQRGFAVEVRGAHAEVLGSRDALHGALLELLDNALVHAREPHVLEVEVDADDRNARIAVLDRGPGVPTLEIERVFEPFHRIGDELTRERPGVGLGLALVARVAQAHGGRAFCEAREGGGSRFVIELPLARAEIAP